MKNTSFRDTLIVPLVIVLSLSVLFPQFQKQSSCFGFFFFLLRHTKIAKNSPFQIKEINLPMLLTS